MQRIIILFLGLLCCAYSYAYIAHQEFPEQILYFFSDIHINNNGSLNITETIKVHGNQMQIKEGLTRWLPIQENNTYFSRLQYQVNDVLLNHKKTPFRIKRESNFFIIQIGHPKKWLAPGNYTYTIHYHVKHAITFLNEQNQLNWNITGNQWNFPIAKAEARITLPRGANIIHYMGYVGFKEDKYPFLRINLPQKNQIFFISTQPLILHRGLIIVIEWPQGFILSPSWQEQIKEAISNNYLPLLMLLPLMILIIIWPSTPRLKKWLQTISKVKIPKIPTKN